MGTHYLRRIGQISFGVTHLSRGKYRLLGTEIFDFFCKICYN